MNRFLIALGAVAMLASASCASVENQDAPALKPRLVVLTDIGPADVEPDDNESAVRLLSYADRFEIEGIACSVGWNCDPYPPQWAEYLYKVIDAYEKDVMNLRKRSGQTEFKSLEEENGAQELGYWPSAEYIRSRSMLGSHRGGIGVIGEDNDSPGSELLIKLADEDDERPIYVCAWGGANTLSQAIWKVQQTRTPEEVKKFVNKFRIYTITDQDMDYQRRHDRAYSSHQWLRREFEKDLLFVWDESAWLNQNSLGRSNWNLYAEHIQDHGAMGSVYPRFKYGVEGDTPSFLNAMPNGLNDPEDPTQAGWGGVHYFGVSPDGITNAWTNWQEAEKAVSNEYEQKFYPDEFNDFAARMQWADEGRGNRNPVVIVNGEPGLAAVKISAKPGETIRLNASKSYDPDGDKLSFSWWFQKSPVAEEFPALSKEDSAKASFKVPADAAGKTYHLICEVHDDGEYNLVAYRRVIVIVEFSGSARSSRKPCLHQG